MKTLTAEQKGKVTKLADELERLALETFPEAKTGKHLEAWEWPELSSSIRELALVIAFQSAEDNGND